MALDHDYGRIHGAGFQQAGDVVRVAREHAVVSLNPENEVCINHIGAPRSRKEFTGPPVVARRQSSHLDAREHASKQSLFGTIAPDSCHDSRAGCQRYSTRLKHAQHRTDPSIPSVNRDEDSRV